MPADAGVEDRRTRCLELLGEFGGLLPGLRVVDQVEQADAVLQDEVVADEFPCATDDFDREAHPLLGGAAPRVRAVVGAGGEHLVDQVALRSHDLDTVVAGVLGQLRRLRERRHRVVDLLGRHRPRPERRDRRLLARRRKVERGVPVAAGVQDLQQDLAVVGVHRVGDDLMLVGLPCVGHLATEGQQPPTLGRRVATGDDQSDTTASTLGEVRRELGQVLELVLHAGVHRTHHDAIAQFGESEVERAEQVRVLLRVRHR